MMRRVWLAGVVFFLTLVSGTTFAADKEDLKKLEGIWLVKTGDVGGVELPAEAKKNARIVFKGDQFIFKGGPNETATAFKIDSTKTPAEIDILPPKNAPKGETPALGIYKFEGDTLTISLSDVSKRPANFKPGKDLMVLILEKEK